LSSAGDFTVPERKFTVEDNLKYLRWVRWTKELDRRESAHYLKELRKERGRSQKQLADRAGVSQQFVSRIESNWVNAGPKTIRRLASALEMDPLELTLIEILYRDTIAKEEYDYLRDHYTKVEELDVDRWTLKEALSRGERSFYETYDEYDEEEWVGGASQEEADRANAVMHRLRERYGARDRREEDWWE
jgi:transcriptional regulator with XRE-family HTH domain